LNSNAKIAIVILNYKGWKDTLECIESLYSQEYKNFRIILVENYSENESLNKFKEYMNGELPLESEYFLHNKTIKKIPYIQYNTEEALQGGISEKESYLNSFQLNEGIVLINNSENLGFSGGNNIGAKYAYKCGYEYVLLLNNDTLVIDKDFLQKLIQPFEIYDHVFLTGPQINNFDATFDGPFIEDTFLGNLFYLSLLNFFRRRLNCPSIYIDIKAISSPRAVPVFKISGACLMFDTKRLHELDYLDENVWLSSEEAILAEKIKAKNGKIIFQPLTTLIHKKAQSPRPKADKYNILKNHYEQRKYFNKHYRKYGFFQMGIIELMTKIRLLLVKIKG